MLDMMQFDWWFFHCRADKYNVDSIYRNWQEWSFKETTANWYDIAISAKKKKNQQLKQSRLGLNKTDLKYKISFHIHFFHCENHIPLPSSSPRSLPSFLSQSHLLNMSRARIRDPISGDGGVVSEAERHCWISQKRLTGERGGGKRDGKWMSSVFLCCHSECVTSVKPHEHLHVSTWSDE